MIIINPYRRANNIPVTGTEFFTAGSSGSLRNDLTYYLGFSFTPIVSNLTITALSRWCHPGNSRSHEIWIGQTSGVVTLYSTTIDMAGQTPGAYISVGIPNLVLTSGVQYFVMCAELSGGDQVANNAIISYNSSVATNNGAYRQSPINGSINAGSTGGTWGPISFKYI